ncbi:MAG: glucan biosynthesis protein [Sphingomonas fennica]
MTRRQLGLGLALLGLGSAWPAWAAPLGAPRRFGWDLLLREAERRAKAPFRPRTAAAGADAIDYDRIGTLTFRPEATLAGGIRLFPVGRYAPEPVRISIVENGRARAVAFDPALFSSSGEARALGYAGFRAMTPDGRSDWLAFQGASYFRSSGSEDQYGLSARAVAIDTGISGKEEFPAFTDFWIERIGPQAYAIHALLDGPSLTGAYRFVCRHEAGGVVQDVSSVLFVRKGIERLGIAPATSMFWYGEGNRAAGVDWRPEIHDSDGLAMWTGAGERIWRPLTNPPGERLDTFADRDPKGFGLMQRDRRFPNYQDDGAFYEKRPNLWVTPRGRWGAGAINLFAFNTTSETVDNVVAFWMPEAKPAAGQRLAFDYRLSWTSTDLSAGPAARAVETFRGLAGRPGAEPVPGAEKIVVDFVGDTLAGLDRQSGVEPKVEVARGRMLAAAAYPVVGQKNRWRVTIDVAPSGRDPAEVRLYLARAGQALTETVLTQAA